jgi:hypothetical protein
VVLAPLDRLRPLELPPAVAPRQCLHASGSWSGAAKNRRSSCVPRIWGNGAAVPLLLSAAASISSTSSRTRTRRFAAVGAGGGGGGEAIRLVLGEDDADDVRIESEPEPSRAKDGVGELARGGEKIVGGACWSADAEASPEPAVAWSV